VSVSISCPGLKYVKIVPCIVSFSPSDPGLSKSVKVDVSECGMREDETGSVQIVHKITHG